jgi:hypothetical protein
VAKNEQDEGQKPLTERELKDLQELARAIVREAGLARDPEREAAEKRFEDMLETYRSHNQSVFEFLKHMMTLSSATIVAVITVSGALFSGAEYLWTIYYSLGLLAFSLSASLFSFSYSTRMIRGVPGSWNWRALPEEELQEKAKLVTRRRAQLANAVVYPWFFGLLFFAWGFTMEVI